MRHYSESVKFSDFSHEFHLSNKNKRSIVQPKPSFDFLNGLIFDVIYLHIIFIKETQFEYDYPLSNL